MTEPPRAQDAGTRDRKTGPEAGALRHRPFSYVRLHNGLEYLCRKFLEPLRARFGPVHVNSGFRTVSYNRSVGGASNSFHIYSIHDGNDQAADITCQRGSPRLWHAFLADIRERKRGGNGGLGLYPGFVHVDIRDYRADWRG
jgi:uncharacterized protein YcbK (DUF882 family)